MDLPLFWCSCQARRWPVWQAFKAVEPPAGRTVGLQRAVCWLGDNPFNGELAVSA
jgi:hypothetical protein